MIPINRYKKYCYTHVCVIPIWIFNNYNKTWTVLTTLRLKNFKYEFILVADMQQPHPHITLWHAEIFLNWGRRMYIITSLFILRLFFVPWLFCANYFCWSHHSIFGVLLKTPAITADVFFLNVDINIYIYAVIFYWWLHNLWMMYNPII